MWFMRTVAVLHSTMRDSEVVAAIVAGDPEGLAEAYDRYASPLYTYCRSLLREPADAADAVQDTFVIAASRLAGLRDRNHYRGQQFQPAAVQPAAVQPAAGRRDHERPGGPASGLSRCA